MIIGECLKFFESVEEAGVAVGDAVHEPSTVGISTSLVASSCKNACICLVLLVP